MKKRTSLKKGILFALIIAALGYISYDLYMDYQAGSPISLFGPRTRIIECEDCEETFKVADLKYIPAEVSEETIEF